MRRCSRRSLALASLKHEVAALFHRAQASDLATGAGVAGAGGGGRIATVGAVVGLCLGGARAGTVCVVTGNVPDLGGDKPAQVHAKHDRAPRKERPRETPPARREPPVVTKASFTPTETKPQHTPASKPKASTARARRRQAAEEAAPREFSFENQAAAGSTAESSATTATSTEAQPPPAPTKTASTTVQSAEQEFFP